MSMLPASTRHTLTMSVACVLSLLMTARAPAKPADEQRTLTVTEALELQSVGRVAISPGGAYIAYTLSVPRTVDDEPGGSFSEIWVMNRSTGSSVRFTDTQDDAGSPQFTPDGKHLAFLKTAENTRAQDDDENGGGDSTQIFLMPLGGGAPTQLTAHGTSVGSYRFTADGAQVAFTARDPEIEAEKRSAKRSGEDWIIAGEERDHRVLWVADTQTGESQRLFEETLHVSDFAWSPDSTVIVFTASESSTTDASMMYNRLYRVPADGGTPVMVYPTEGKLGNIAFSPDNTKLAWRGAVNISDSLAQSIFVFPAHGEGRSRNITTGWEASVNDFDWVDNERIVALCSEGTHTTLSLVNVTTLEREMLVADAPSTWGFAYDRRAKMVAMSGSTPLHPGELFVIPLENPKPERLTFHNPILNDMQLATQESMEWESTDGQRIEGMITFPVGFDPNTKYPLIANPHGGPEGADRFSWDTWPQLLAARGYIVFQPNYRGSAGRGPTWTAGDHGDLGGMEFTDLLTGIDALIARGFVDGDRVGIGGWSYGGYFSALGATHHSHRFKAAVMGAGISNWVSFTGSTDIPHENSYTHWNRWLNENADLYWKGSPLSQIDNANTPTLILHGQNDARVPVQQAYEMYLALKDKGVPVQFVIYPRNGHGVRERTHRLDLTTRMLDWFDQYVK